MSHGRPNSPGEFSLGSSFRTVLLFIKVARDFAAGNGKRMGIEIISAAIETMPSTDKLVRSPWDEVIDCDFDLRKKEDTMFEGERDGYRGKCREEVSLVQSDTLFCAVAAMITNIDMTDAE